MTILFGRRHCCACAGVCSHIGPVQLCVLHSERKRTALAFLMWLAFAVVPLLATGCNLQLGGDQVTNVTNTSSVPAPGASPSTAPSSTACPLPTRVNLGIGGCSSGVAIQGVCGPLSLTPFIGTIESPKACDDARQVVWIASPTTACRVQVNDNPYVPDVVGLAEGTCQVHATVDGVSSAAVVVQVRK